MSVEITQEDLIVNAGPLKLSDLVYVKVLLMPIKDWNLFNLCCEVFDRGSSRINEMVIDIDLFKDRIGKDDYLCKVFKPYFDLMHSDVGEVKLFIDI